MGTTAPVTNDEADESSHRTASTRSSGVPKPPSGYGPAQPDRAHRGDVDDTIRALAGHHFAEHLTRQHRAEQVEIDHPSQRILCHREERLPRTDGCARFVASGCVDEPIYRFEPGEDFAPRR